MRFRRSLFPIPTLPKDHYYRNGLHRQIPHKDIGELVTFHSNYAPNKAKKLEKLIQVGAWHFDKIEAEYFPAVVHPATEEEMEQGDVHPTLKLLMEKEDIWHRGGYRGWRDASNFNGREEEIAAAAEAARAFQVREISRRWRSFDPATRDGLRL